jgi:DNA-directed RNA polymerase specialized sigma24 family protein
VSWSDSRARTGPHEIGLIAARNDDDATRRLYRNYRMELFRYGVHVLHDQGLAEEMVQETFIRFCQRAGSYDAGRGPVRGWPFTMAKSVAVDIARRPSSRPFLPVEDFQLPPQYDSVDEALTVFTVDQALDKLPSIYAEVMRLVRDGFTPSPTSARSGSSADPSSAGSSTYTSEPRRSPGQVW